MATDRDERKLETIIAAVRLAEREGATINTITKEMKDMGFSADEASTALKYMAS